MDDKPQSVQDNAFILRCWHIDDFGLPQWRYSLQQIPSGTRHGFASLAELLAYLESIQVNNQESDG